MLDRVSENDDLLLQHFPFDVHNWLIASPVSPIDLGQLLYSVVFPRIDIKLVSCNLRGTFGFIEEMRRPLLVKIIANRHLHLR